MNKFAKAALTVLSLVLVAALAITGTVAWLTWEESDVNVMTVGNVQIDQIEQQWNEDKTELVDFRPGKPLFPYVGAFGWENTEDAGGAYRRFTMNNVVDKYVSVKNTGKSDAYVRTVIAFEMGDYSVEEFNMIGLSNNSMNGSEFQFDGAWEWTEEFATEIDGHNYYVMVAVHRDAVKPGETTIPSLLQVYLSKDADNAEVERLDGNKNGTYDILVCSQAVQTAGFEDADEAFDGIMTYAQLRTPSAAEIALNTAFYNISKTEHPWAEEGNEPVIPTVVSTVEDMMAVCKTGGHMILNNDIVYTAKNTEEMIDGSIFLINGKNVTLDLNGYSITVAEDATQLHGAIFFVGNPGGHINIVGDGDITVKNGLATVVWVLQSGTANVYGGNYISNSASNEAMMYSQGNGGVINIYGGRYTYDLDRHLNGGFNVSDLAGGALRIIIHEGVLLSRPEYSQHLQGTSNGEQARIQLAEGCAIESVDIDGETWYEVVKQ